MMAELRREANAAAQDSLRSMVAYMVRHGGKRNPLLEDAYRAAERVVDAVDDYETYLRAAEQEADEEAPDFHAMYAEGDLRAFWGNR